MNENFQKILTLILQVANAGTVEVPIILGAFNALKAETGMSDDELAADTEARGNELEAKIIKRLAEMGG